MSLRSDFDALFEAVSPEALVVMRSAENGCYYVIVEDRRINGKPFDRVGIGNTMGEAVALCLERWHRATPEEVWVDPES